MVGLNKSELLHACRRHRIMSAEVMGPSEEYQGRHYIEVTDIEGFRHDIGFYFADERPYPIVEPENLVGRTVEEATDLISRRQIAEIQRGG